MSLRGEPVEQRAVLPNGREVTIRIGVPDDSYVAKKELRTVDVEVFEGATPLAAVTTILEPEQTSEARALAREIAAGLESGELEPTASAIEALGDRLP